MNKRPVSIRLMPDILNDVNSIVKSNPGRWRTRADFLREAITEKLRYENTRKDIDDWKEPKEIK